MNIAISGYGRMGRIIKKIAEEKGHVITAVIDPASPDASFKEITSESLKDADVVIDFSVPDAAVDNIKRTAEAGVNMVTGTTGWYGKMDEVRKIVEESGTGFIWSGNFSIGVNIFFSIIETASSIFNHFDEYDPFIHEYHHRLKADSPSGTAVMTGNIMLDRLDRKKTIVTDALRRRIEPEELHISSTRGGSIPGTHIVTFDSQVDTIEIKHTARGREGFASGAVAAAGWIRHRSGFFEITDMMKEIIKGEM